MTAVVVVSTGSKGHSAPGANGRSSVKKLVLVALVAGAGVALWRKVGAGKSGQELWSSATDSVR